MNQNHFRPLSGFVICALLAMFVSNTAATAASKSCTYRCTQTEEAELVTYGWVLDDECRRCLCPSPRANNCGQPDGGYSAAAVGDSFQVACSCSDDTPGARPDPTPVPTPTPTPVPTPTYTTEYKETACTYTCSRFDGSANIDDFGWALDPSCRACDCPAPRANNCGQPDGDYPARSIGDQFQVRCQCPYTKEIPPPTPTPTPIPTTCDCDADAARGERESIALAVKFAVNGLRGVRNRLFTGDLGNIEGYLSGEKGFCYDINGEVAKRAATTLKRWYPIGLRCYQFGNYFNSTTVLGEEIYGHNQVIRCPIGVTDPRSCLCYDPWSNRKADPVQCASASSEIQLVFDSTLDCKLPAPKASPSP